MNKSIMFSALLLASSSASAFQPTKYPVIFAHGMAGWNSIAGFSYFGDDYGVFDGKTCASGGACNRYIPNSQVSAAFQVSWLNNSEVRGKQLHDAVLNYCASNTNPSTGKSVCDVGGVKKVNFIGHSQGGMDMRKAARMLKTDGIGTAGMISISSPHRGSPMAYNALAIYGQTANAVGLIADWIGSSPVLGGGQSLPQDAIGTMKQLIDKDYDPNDGITTGTIQFNKNYPGTGDAEYLGSVITSQATVLKNPLLLAMGLVVGYSADDGLVNTDSQQMGVRIKYTESYPTLFGWVPGSTTELSYLGSVTDLNNPSYDQRTSKDGVLQQDHLDVLSLGLDTLNEHEFYANLMGLLASKGK